MTTMRNRMIRMILTFRTTMRIRNFQKTMKLWNSINVRGRNCSKSNSSSSNSSKGKVGTASEASSNKSLVLQPNAAHALKSAKPIMRRKMRKMKVSSRRTSPPVMMMKKRRRNLRSTQTKTSHSTSGNRSAVTKSANQEATVRRQSL